VSTAAACPPAEAVPVPMSAAPGRQLVAVPYGSLARLFTTTASAAPERHSEPPALTPRQSAVLGLMAEGDGNAVIARTLNCSEHTVKNVIYELMGRLQARNRAHAVAHAVRGGLI